jgi:uncharacterized protein
MKIAPMIIFITFALSVYLAGNFYVFYHGWQVLPDKLWLKIPYVSFFIIISISFFLSKILEKTSLHNLNAAFTWIGAFGWSFLLYLFIIVLFIDLIRLFNHWIDIPFLRNIFNYQFTGQIALIATIALVVILNIAGFINAANPRIKNISLQINKSAGTRKELRIAMASDIHLGTLVGKSKLENLVKTINDFNPDIVFLAGDILDENHTPIFLKDLGAPLRNIKSPLGVYAITGNHEYIGGIKKAIDYIESLNIKMLRDTSVLIDNSFYIIGREDVSSFRFSEHKRKELQDLCSGIDFAKPVILLDHEPYHLEEAEKIKADLQLSGHTHHGQMWPINNITSAIFEVSWGYKKKNDTHVYVSSGYGTWGPPVRIGNRPETVLITLSFGAKN